MAISIKTEGRRFYLVGDTYSIKDRLKNAGCKWDPAKKAWWTGKFERAEAIVEEQKNSTSARSEAPESKVVAGRATYKGKSYYLAGRTVKGRSVYDDTVDMVLTRDSSKVLLYFRDGSSQFWAPYDAVQIKKVYQKPTTIKKLQDFAQDPQGAIRSQAKRRGWDGVVGSSSYYTSGLYDEES